MIKFQNSGGGEDGAVVFGGGEDVRWRFRSLRKQIYEIWENNLQGGFWGEDSNKSLTRGPLNFTVRLKATHLI